MTQCLHNWEPVVQGGFGDKYNICTWSFVVFKNCLYAGTLNPFHGGQIYRSKTGDKGTWLQVNINGFGNESIGVRNMTVFKNLLWVVAYSEKYGIQVWVTNGKDDKNGLILWKKANIIGFGKGNQIPGSRAMVIYKNHLYIGTQCKTGFPHVYRYDGPTDFEKIQAEKWTWINKSLEKDTKKLGDYSIIGTMACFKAPDGKEYLYTGIYSEVASLLGELKRKFSIKTILKILKFHTLIRCRVFRYDEEKWEEVIKPGFGKPNIMTQSVAILNENLYFGTSNFFGTEIWKTVDGINWIQIAKKGFKKSFNASLWALGTYKNRLIIGIQNLVNGGQIWASINSNPSSNEDFIQIRNNCANEKSKSKQDGIRTFQEFNKFLYAGTSSNINPVYSKDPRSGCEIWRINHL